MLSEPVGATASLFTVTLVTALSLPSAFLAVMENGLLPSTFRFTAADQVVKLLAATTWTLLIIIAVLAALVPESMNVVVLTTGGITVVTTGLAGAVVLRPFKRKAKVPVRAALV